MICELDVHKDVGGLSAYNNATRLVCLTIVKCNKNLANYWLQIKLMQLEVCMYVTKQQLEPVPAIVRKKGRIATNVALGRF